MSRNENQLGKHILAIVIGTLFCCQFTLGQSAKTDPVEPAAFIDESDITWKVNDFNVARWKTLIGGSEGGQLDNSDIQFGLWQLAPGQTYHSHKHSAPEVYYILSGKAEWTVGGITRKVSAGTAIYTRPGKIHKMVNLTDEPVKTVWFWWAPGGEREVFNGEYLFTEPALNQPEKSGFQTGDEEKLH